MMKWLLERETGLERATSSLGSWHSTTELLPLVERLQADSNRSVQELTLPHGAAACVAPVAQFSVSAGPPPMGAWLRSAAPARVRFLPSATSSATRFRGS